MDFPMPDLKNFKPSFTCETCVHQKVCSLKQVYVSAQTDASNVVVHLGDGRSKRLSDFDWIKPVKLQCIHWVRSSDSMIR